MGKFKLIYIFCLIGLVFTARGGVQAQAAATVCANNAPSTSGGAWESRAPSLLHRSETAATVLDNKLYIAGGFAGLTTLFTGVSASFEVYDPVSDNWKELAPLPKALHHIGLASAHSHIYLTGGYSALDFIANTKSAWAYDPQADTWVAIADMPAPRAAHNMATINDIVYLVGGVTDASTALWTYDPVADKWNTQHQPMPTAREHVTSQVVDGKLYVIGGEVPNKNGTGNETFIRLANNEVYDPAADQWTALAPMPTARASATSAVLDGKIHVTSGENVQDKCVFAQHEVYDPKTDQWSTMADMGTPRHSSVSGVIGGFWYVVDGATKPGVPTITSLSNKVEIFTLTPPK